MTQENIIFFLLLLAEQYLTGTPLYSFYPDEVIRVTSVILEPHLMDNPDYYEDSRRPRYIGFIPDLLKEIAELTGMKYVIKTAPDNSFGYKQADGSWDGMIGELVRQEADLAAAPMYKTTERQQVVDFSFPYLDVHATLLIRKPVPGVKPKITSVSNLLEQSEFQFGTLDRGIIVRAFKNTNSTTLKKVWRKMVTFKPSVFTSSNREGIARVRRSRYVFIIPHTIGDYMSMQEPCDLLTVDRFLLKGGYCLAVGKGSELLTQFNLAIHVLRENGRLYDLYRTWWLDRSQCDPVQSSKIYGSAYVARSLSISLSFSSCLMLSSALSCHISTYIYNSCWI